MKMVVKFLERSGWLGRIVEMDGNMALVKYSLPLGQEDRYAWFQLDECDDDGSYPVWENTGIIATEEEIRSCCHPV